MDPAGAKTLATARNRRREHRPPWRSTPAAALSSPAASPPPPNFPAPPRPPTRRELRGTWPASPGRCWLPGGVHCDVCRRAVRRCARPGRRDLPDWLRRRVRFKPRPERCRRRPEAETTLSCSKLSADGSHAVYATFLGGSGTRHRPQDRGRRNRAGGDCRRHRIGQFSDHTRRRAGNSADARRVISPTTATPTSPASTPPARLVYRNLPRWRRSRHRLRCRPR